VQAVSSTALDISSEKQLLIKPIFIPEISSSQASVQYQDGYD
jgi:hypothetical protein